ncbi:hypothetical protein ACOSQ3_001372 [Xanthoceras sorbifolium]
MTNIKIITTMTKEVGDHFQRRLALVLLMNTHCFFGSLCSGFHYINPSPPLSPSSFMKNSGLKDCKAIILIHEEEETHHIIKTVLSTHSGFSNNSEVHPKSPCKN